MLQAKACGLVNDIWEMRKIIANSLELVKYEPEDKEAWDAAYDKYLNHFTANSTGATVLAGPQEGTAIGNIMLQAKAAGEVADIWQMRKIIADSIEMVKYEPKDADVWAQAFDKYLSIINK
jgi:uncharacterized protein YeaO (DUF488 family)